MTSKYFVNLNTQLLYLTFIYLKLNNIKNPYTLIDKFFQNKRSSSNFMKTNKKNSLIGLLLSLVVFANESSSNTATWDFDVNGEVDALTDGLLFLRHAFGQTGNNLTEGALSPNSTMTSSEVEQNIKNTLVIADIDYDGKVDALTDGLILIRYLFGVRGQGLVDQVISANANRNNSSEIENYILQHMPDSTGANCPSELSDCGHIQTAKDMIENVREFGLQSTFEDSDESSVAEQIQLAASLSTDQELDAISDSIEIAIMAFGAANAANLNALVTDGYSLSTYTYIDYYGVTAPVSITEIDNGYQYRINSPLVVQAPNNIAVNLDLIAQLSMDENEQDISLKLSGTLSSPHHDATITNGDINISLHENNSESYVTDSLDFGLEDFDQDQAIAGTCLLDIAINLIIEQTNTNDPVTFTGLFSQSPIIFSACSGSNDSATIGSGNEFKTLVLGGKFEQNNNSVQANFQVSSQAETSDDFNSTGSLLDVLNIASNIDRFDEIVLNTNQLSYGDYIGISLILESSAVSDITGLNIAVGSNEDSGVIFNMNVAFGSSRLGFDIRKQENNPSLTVTDQNGSKFQITAYCDELSGSCETLGNIMVDDEIVATISYDQENNVYIILYNDNSFEVL